MHHELIANQGSTMLAV